MESLESEGKVAEEPTPEIAIPTPRRKIYRASTHCLEGESVHVCTQLYTCVYTLVYSRVHYFALGISPIGLSLVPFPGYPLSTTKRYG